MDFCCNSRSYCERDNEPTELTYDKQQHTSGADGEESTDPTDPSVNSVATPSTDMQGRPSALKGWQKVIDLNCTSTHKFEELRGLNQQLVESVYNNYETDGSSKTRRRHWLQDKIERVQMEMVLAIGEQTDATQAKLQQWKLSRQQAIDEVVAAHEKYKAANNNYLEYSGADEEKKMLKEKMHESLDALNSAIRLLKEALRQQMIEQSNQLMASAFAKAKEEHG